MPNHPRTPLPSLGEPIDTLNRVALMENAGTHSTHPPAKPVASCCRGPAACPDAGSAAPVAAVTYNPTEPPDLTAVWAAGFPGGRPRHDPATEGLIPYPDVYQDVRDFHAKFGCLIGIKPAEPDSAACMLRERLIDEERRELRHAMALGNLPEIADAIGDLVYVLMGTAVAYGIDMRPVWAAIHAANMAKVGGGTRDDGKVMKPEGWVAPDIAGELTRQGWDRGSSRRETDQ